MNPLESLPRLMWCGLLGLISLGTPCLRADDGSDLWLKYRTLPSNARLEDYRQRFSSILVTGESPTAEAVRRELRRGLGGLLGHELPLTDVASQASLLAAAGKGLDDLPVQVGRLDEIGAEGFQIRSINLFDRPVILIAANQDIGLLYGAFHLLRLIQTQQPLDGLDIRSRPKIRHRLLNHWDNLDGSVERGYAGRSLWKWDELPARVDPRYREYARANASIGINGTVLNNVNANPEILRSQNLAKVARLADIFRPYGIRVFLSVNFSSPISARFELESNRKGGIGDLATSDPADPGVRGWWKQKADEIYRLIPDFGGFLVKANSEGMPGPQDYGRSHAEGANMLAEALAPHGGIVMWRAFVYRPETDPDRAKRAYKEFVPLDGKFAANVFVQAKNGPIDFQPREPVQPLFGAMTKTPTLLELQITQEYLGHSTHLVYLAPMWKEYLDFDTYARGRGSTLAKIVDGSLFGHSASAIAGVANTGSDANWTGHLFAQANWFAFGRLAWDHTLDPDEIASDWIRMTLSNDDRTVREIQSMMEASWPAAVDYMTPLGLHHIMQEGFHYGPQPDHDQGRPDWTSVYYHRADSNGLGFDRSSSGSGATLQYAPPLRMLFDDIRTCPEKYLLWFHHVGWDRILASGRTLWEELCYRYRKGVQEVGRMRGQWEGLKERIDPDIFTHVRQNLAQQERDAARWQEVCLKYFQRFSQKPIPAFK